MSERSQRLTDALAALDRGDTEPLEALLRPEAQWRAVDGVGWGGQTPL